MMTRATPLAWRRSLMSALGLCAALATAALAQTAPTDRPPGLGAATPAAAGPGVSPDESQVVAQLEVLGRRPGPALWRVRRGDSEVIILGGLSPLPHLLRWDTIRVEHALEDSTVFYKPPSEVHVGLFEAASLFLRQGALKVSTPGGMEAGLPPDLKARFDQVRDELHLDPKRYQAWKPAVAGLLLVGDYRRAAGLSDDKPGTTVAKMARAANAEVRVVGELKIKPLFDAAAKMSKAQNEACLRAALDEIQWESGHARAAADAWAVGDLKTVRANSASALLDSCLLQLPTVQAVVEKGTEDGVQTLNLALSRPGKSVALVDLTFLLRPNGVLDRLKAEGDQITVPGG